MKTLLCSILFSLITVGAAAADTQVDRTISADSDVRIEIDVVTGNIEISVWDRNEVQVTGTIGDDVEELEISGEGGHIEIDVEIPEGRSHRRRDIDVNLEIRVPHGSRLDVETVSAPITVSGVRGRLELGSVSGDVRATGAAAAADLESVSGSIWFSGSGSSVEAESVSGSVHLEGVAGSVEVSAVSGQIEVEAGEVSVAQFESVSGRVDFSGSLSSSARVKVKVHSSNVTLRLPADTSASFDLSTFSGNLHSAFGGTAERTSSYAPGKRMDFSAGGGGARVSIDTFSGNVKIEKQ